MKKNNSVSEKGQYGLIDYFARKFNIRNSSSILGIGDDAAVLHVDDSQLITTSLFLEGINFDLIYTPLQHLGYKIIVAAISDIYAMNGQPSQLLLNIGVSKKTNMEQLELLMDGVSFACETYGLDLVGFKPSASFTGLTISATVTGRVEPDKLVKRSTAQATDLICVSGDLGGSLMGLYLLEREKRVLKSTDVEPEFGNNDYVLKRQLKPDARVDILKKLEEYRITPTSMICVNDGLAAALLLMSKASDVGCRVYEKKIPVHQGTLKAANELNFNPIVAALNGGEDYELMFTISLADFEKHQDSFIDDVSVIGYVTEATKACRLFTLSDQEVDIKARGWGVEHHNT